jgi:hypothetical protein
MFLNNIFFKLIVCFLFFYRLAIASPTDEAILEKIDTHHLNKQEKSPDLEQTNSLKFPKNQSIEDINLPNSPHLVGSSLGFGLNYLVGTVAEDSPVNSNGIEIQINHEKVINTAFTTHISLNKDGWTQLSFGQREYFADTPIFRPFYNLKLGTTLKPSEYLAGFIIYQRYFVAAQTGLEFMWEKTPFQIAAEGHLALLGFQYSGSFLYLKKF